MTLTMLIILGVLVLGIAIGAGIAQARSGESKQETLSEQEVVKNENKEKILASFTGAVDGKVTNNDIEKLLGVADSTVTRYLEELEREGKIHQVGTEGRSVFYEVSK